MAGVLLLLGTALRAAAEEDPGDAHDRLLTTIERMLTPDQRAEFHFLLHLGWRLVPTSSTNVIEYHGGHPGFRESLGAAHAAGDLRILVPHNVTRNQLEWLARRLPIEANSLPSRLAYKHRVHEAVGRAARRLAANAESGRYVFPQLLFWDSPWFRLVLPPPNWAEAPGKIHVGRRSSAAAVEAFYEKSAVAECYVAQWVAIFAIQYELFGPQWFQEVFRPDELVLGRPRHVRDSEFGKHLRVDSQAWWRALVIPYERQREDPGLVLAELGPKAFSGLTGILQSTNEARRSNENFTIVSISPRAVAYLRDHGGFACVEKVTTEAKRWQEASRPLLVAGHQLFRYRQRREAALSTPILTDLWLYIHPFGIVTLRWVVEQKLRVKHNALKLRLYSHGMEDAFYQRYREAFKERWLREHPAALTAPVSAPTEAAPVPSVPPATPPATQPLMPGELPPPRVRKKTKAASDA